MTLRRYLTRLFAARALGALLALAALLQLLDLLDRASDVLAGGGGAAEVARYAALRFPTLLGHAVPLAVLAGAALAFLRLAATSEMAALRAAGVGAWRVLGALAPACAAAAALQLALLLVVAPRTERALADWWDGRDAAAASGEAVALPRRLWLRDGIGGDVVAADAVSLDGSRLGGVLIVRRDAGGGIVERVEARGAEHRGTATGWVLREASVVRPGRPRAEAAAELAWPDGPPPAAMRELARPTEAVAPDRLLAGLRGEGAASRGPAFYATRAQTAAASPVGPFLMALLAAPAVFGAPRRGGGWRRAAVGLALGLGYLVAAGLLAALGEAGALPPVLAAWAPPFLFAAAGVLLLQREEG